MANDVFPRTGGRSWRKIDLRNADDHTAVGWLEDDFHHFGVTVVHDGSVIQDVRVASPRFPWETCPAAGNGLRDLIGKPLVARATDIGQMLDMRLHCTHMFDLAGLVIAQAHRGTRHRRYEACVTDRPVILGKTVGETVFGPGRATLLRDGVEVLAWDIDGETITGPADIAGHGLERGFRAWTEAMSEDKAECATVLRRAIRIALGRTFNYDLIERADDMGLPALCHTFQPEFRKLARHMHGSVVNYESGQGMLSEVDKIP